MKLFGSLTEYIASIFRKNSQNITLRPNQTTTYTAARDIQLPLGDQDDVLVGRISSDTGTARLKNKELEDNTVLFVDNSDTTKKFRTENSGSTTGTTTILATNSTANRTVTLPDGGTLATLAGTETLTNKTLTSPIESNPTVRGTLLLQNTSGSQPILALSEDPDNGTNVVNIQAPATLAGDYTLTLPVDDGASGEVLSTNGSGVLSWVSAITNPMDSAGDMIYGGVGGVATKLDSGTAGTWLVSAGAAAPTWTSTVTTGKVIDGTVDEIQLRIQGHSTQTAAPFVVEKSDGTDMLAVTQSGGIGLLGINTTTTPDGVVHAVGSNFSPQLVIERTTSNTGKWSFSADSDTLSIRDVVASSTRMTIDSSGAVNLGPTAGAVTHQVNGRVNFNTTETTIPADGIRRAATNELRLSTNSTDKVYLQTSGSNGMLGVNETVPEGPVHATGIAFSPQIYLERTSNNTGKYSLGVTSDSLSVRDEVAGAVRLNIESTGVVTSYNGFRLDDDTSAGGSTVLSYYREATHATTFTYNNGATSASKTIRVTRFGRVVNLIIPDVTLAEGGGTASAVLASDTALPSWARPAAAISNVQIAATVLNAGTPETGRIQVTSAGIIEIRREDGLNTFSGTAGTGEIHTISYIVD